MATVKLDKLSIIELRELATAIDRELGQREREEVKKTAQQMKELAASLGMSVDEILGYGKKINGKKSPPKYQHPENPQQTWTGKGRQPEWFKELVTQGRTFEELKIET